MCLIIRKPADCHFTDEFLEGVFKKNKDGLGCMYAENNVLYYVKSLPKSFADVKAFWEAHVEGRECAVHFRMQTHGLVDTANCHPYEVLGGDYPLFLIHNGILHTDNEEDETKSDTWHYIKNYLRPMLEHNPTWFMTEAFQELVSKHIGTGNKFVLLDAYGNMVTINEDRGVKYNGAWLSNTYAWDTTGTEFEPKGYAGYAGAWGRSSLYDPDWRREIKPRPMLTHVPDDDLTFGDDIGTEAEMFAADLWDALQDADMMKAYNTLKQAEVVSYYEVLGDAAWDVLEMVSRGAYTDDELIDEILYGTLEWKGAEA